MKLEGQVSEQIVILLENLTFENTGWKRFFFRWVISDEPLRRDAGYILELIKTAQEKEGYDYFNPI